MFPISRLSRGKNHTGVILITLAFSVSAAFSQTYEWTGGGGATNTWATTANWTPAAASIPANGDFLFSDNSGALTAPITVVVATDRVVNSLTYDSKLSYNIDGSTAARRLTFGDTGVAGLPSILISTGKGPQANHEINTLVTVAELLTITNNSSDNLTFNGALTNNGGIAVYGTGAVALDGTLSGAGSIDKYGSGTLFANTANPGTIGINVHEGVYSASVQFSLFNGNGAAAVPLVVQSGASIETGYAGQVDTSNNTSFTPKASGTGVHYALQGDVGAIYAAPLMNGTSTMGTVTMLGNTSYGAFAGSTLSMIATDAGAGYTLTKVGQGQLRLRGTGSWSGDTIITEGLLSATTTGLSGGYTTPAASPKPGRLVLAGGVFGLDTAATDFTRSLGTGANQVYWTGDGGFAANNAASAVNLGGAKATVTWGAGGFVPTGNALIFGHEMASGYTIDFQNGINLGSQTREIRTFANSPATPNTGFSDASLSGVLTGTGGINKTGDGVLALIAANTYSGETRISDGALSFTGYTSAQALTTGSSNNSHIVFDGGVLMPSSGAASTSTAVTYTPTLGTGAGQVSWDGDGGFAAYSGRPTTVTLNNDATTPLVWGSTAGFLGDGDTLMLGYKLSAASVTLNNAIDLNGGNRTIQTTADTSSNSNSGTGTTGDALTVDVILTQNISGGGTLNFTGDGEISLRAANTTTAAVNITGATVWLESKTGTGAYDGTLNNAGDITISQGGTLISGTGTATASASNEIGRINDSSTVNLNGGTLQINSATTLPQFTETIAGINLSGGSNNVVIDSAQTVLAVSGALTRSNHATVDFTPTNVGAGNSSNSQVTFGTAPILTNGILPYATVGGVEFATYGASGIVENTGTATANASWTSSINYRGGAQALTADRTVNSLTLTSGAISGSTANLTVSSGGIIAAMGTADETISTATLKSGSNELFLHTNDSSGAINSLNISSSIQNGALGATALVKDGNGSATLTGSSTYTGGTFVNEGSLILNNTSGSAIGGNITVGDRAGDDSLRLTATNQFSSSTSLTLKGGDPSNAGGATATLGFNGLTAAGADLPSLEATLDQLTVSQSGIIDFAGGLNDATNYLYLNTLAFDDPASMLTITNWRQYKDYFLITDAAAANFPSYSSQIHFDGYEGTSTLTNYGNGYWQVTPLGDLNAVPEPASAMLALSSLSLLFRRRRS